MTDTVKDAWCPKCQGRIIYNGIYYCDDCNWAMNPDGQHTAEDRSIIRRYLWQRKREALDSRDKARIDFYLSHLEDETS